jgi:hypothetical protein
VFFFGCGLIWFGAPVRAATITAFSVAGAASLAGAVLKAHSRWLQAASVLLWLAVLSLLAVRLGPRWL